MRALHLLLALALALFAAGAPAANSADIKRQFPTLDKNKIVVSLVPNQSTGKSLRRPNGTSSPKSFLAIFYQSNHITLTPPSLPQVKLWPTKRGKEHDNGWSYREVSLDAEQCVNFSDIGPGYRFNGISSLRQYPHQYGSRYYCKYYQ